MSGLLFIGHLVITQQNTSISRRNSNSDIRVVSDIQWTGRYDCFALKP